jgi:antitoxin component HigA of HigAB toxin-antitoxin module
MDIREIRNDREYREVAEEAKKLMSRNPKAGSEDDMLLELLLMSLNKYDGDKDHDEG